MSFKSSLMSFEDFKRILIEFWKNHLTSLPEAKIPRIDEKTVAC